MRNLLLMLMFSCVCAFADASVLGIFEDTNFPVGISGERDGVHRMEVINDELYAATEKGIYKYSESANSWNIWALEYVNVMDFKVNGDEVVAIIVPQDQKGFRAVQLARLIRFNRNQSEWEDIMDADMGYYYHEQFLTYVMRLAQHPSKPETLMVAAHPGIWISEDFGSTWNFKLDGLYSYNENQFLGWHPTNNNVAFYTSESDTFSAQILRTENGGNDWDIINPDSNGDNSCHNLAFDPDNADNILYSGEGCIFESNDYGKTWQCVYRQDDLRDETEIGYAYNVMFDPENTNIVYCVGACSIHQDIHIFKSANKGKTWARIARSDLFDTHEYWPYESVLFNGRIYLYTQKGVFTYNIDNNSGIENIKADNNDGAEILYDLMGRRVDTPNHGTIYIQSGKKILIK